MWLWRQVQAQCKKVSSCFFNFRTKEGEREALEIHDEKYSGKAWTVKVREVLENLEQVRPSCSLKRQNHEIRDISVTEQGQGAEICPWMSIYACVHFFILIKTYIIC